MRAPLPPIFSVLKTKTLYQNIQNKGLKQPQNPFISNGMRRAQIGPSFREARRTQPLDSTCSRHGSVEPNISKNIFAGAP